MCSIPINKVSLLFSHSIFYIPPKKGGLNLEQMFPERKSDAMTVGQLTKRINKDKISKKESKIFFTLFNITI